MTKAERLREAGEEAMGLSSGLKDMASDLFEVGRDNLSPGDADIRALWRAEEFIRKYKHLLETM